MENFQTLLSKYLKNINNILEEPLNTNNFKIDKDELTVRKWGNFVEISVDFEWEFQNKDLYNDYNDFTWINFLYEQKFTEFKTFVDNIKNGKFAVFHNVIEDDEPYYIDYPHLMFGFPYKDGFRFIMIGCEDFITLEDEHLLCDILVDKNLIITEFDNILKEIESITKKEFSCEE